MGLIDAWQRRSWRRDPAAIAALPGSRPAIVITGGSDGIGLALAHAFACDGHALVLVARDPVRLAAAARTLEAGATAAVLTVAHDVTATDAAAAIRQTLAANDLYADILVNSAGIATTGEFATADSAQIRQTTALNVTALTSLTRAFLPDMLVRGRGGIIHVASLGGFVPGPYQAAYYASKAYVISLTRALAHETRGQGVRILCAAPGPVATRFHVRSDGLTSLYSRILPTLTPAQCARAIRRGYRFGQTIVVPGIWNRLLAVVTRVMPGVLTVPVVAVLLKPRRSHPPPDDTNRPPV